MVRTKFNARDTTGLFQAAKGFVAGDWGGWVFPTSCPALTQSAHKSLLYFVLLRGLVLNMRSRHKVVEEKILKRYGYEDMHGLMNCQISIISGM